MTYLNIRVIQENKIIKLRFEYIYLPTQVDPDLTNFFDLIDLQKILQWKTLKKESLLDFFELMEPTDLEKLLAKEEFPTVSIAAQDQWQMKAIQYNLPSKPQAALNFLLLVGKYCFEYFHPRQEIKKAELKLWQEDICSQFNLFRESLPGSGIRKLIFEILKFKNHKDLVHYRATINTIEKIYNNIENIKYLPFAFFCFNFMQRFRHLFQGFKNLIDTEIADKKDAIQVLTQEIMHTEHKAEANYFFKLFDLAIKKNFFSHCIGKLSPDQNFYSWMYAEHDFIKEAEFYLRPDNRMVIRNIANNAAYIKHFINISKDEFQQKMQTLAPLVGVEYSPDSDFQHEIIFTPLCTKYLFSIGFNSINLIKESIRQEKIAQNSRYITTMSNLFLRIPKNNTQTSISDLSKEVLNWINEKNAPYPEILDQEAHSQFALKNK